MNYALHLLVLFEIYVILALSLNLVVGYCGILSLAHAGYFAIGAYVYSLLSLQAGWEFPPAALAAAIIAAALSVALSLATWRLRGDFFVLASLAAQSLIFSALHNWHTPNALLGSLPNLTNGPFGISGIPQPVIAGQSIATPMAFALVSSCIAVGCAAVLWRLQASPWGRILRCLRDDELAARGLGKNTRLAKVQAFAVSTAMAAIAGALYASYIRFIDPSLGRLDESILMLSMVIIGGAGNFRGPVFGAVIVVALPELLRFVAMPEAQAANLRLLIYGLLLIVFMRLRRQGVAGEYRMQ